MKHIATTLHRVWPAAALVFAQALLLSACGDIDRIRVGLGDDIARLDSKRRIDLGRNGVAFMTLGSADKCIGGVHSITFQAASGSGPELSFDAATTSMQGVSDHVIQTPQSCVQLVGMSLPPGEYRISGFKWFQDFGTQTQRLSAARPVSVPFTVKAGQITYLGSFQMSFVYGKTVPGRTAPAAAEYDVGDELRRDADWLRAMRPEFTGIPVTTQLPPDDGGASGFPRSARSQSR
jgi:hypothetical protein